MRTHDASALLRACARGRCTDGRTDELTESPTHLAQPPQVSNAHEIQAMTSVESLRDACRYRARTNGHDFVSRFDHDRIARPAKEAS